MLAFAVAAADVDFKNFENEPVLRDAEFGERVVDLGAFAFSEWLLRPCFNEEPEITGDTDLFILLADDEETVRLRGTGRVFGLDVNGLICGMRGDGD